MSWYFIKIFIVIKIKTKLFNLNEIIYIYIYIVFSTLKNTSIWINVFMRLSGSNNILKTTEMGINKLKQARNSLCNIPDKLLVKIVGTRFWQNGFRSFVVRFRAKTFVGITGCWTLWSSVTTCQNKSCCEWEMEIQCESFIIYKTLDFAKYKT